jgi:hypothetical protein
MGEQPGAPSHAWPPGVAEVVDRFLVCEVTTLTRTGRPITWPLTPYLGQGGATIDVSTGVTYPAKAERARRDPRVAVLFSDPKGSGIADPPLVLVQGLATVRDADIQANTDRYVGQSLKKLPGAWRHQPRALVRAQTWYWARIYVEVTPTRIMWWPRRRLEGEPEVWEPTGLAVAPPSDPAPSGPGPGPWQRPAPPWRTRASDVVGRLPAPVLSVVGDDGFPLSGPCRRAGLSDTGFELEVPEWLAPREPGPACLSFSTVHGEDFRGQENAVFVGTADGDGVFRVDRLLPDFSLPSRGMAKYRTFFNVRGRLAGRLEAECRRRGQPVPVVNLPASIGGS